VPYPAVGLERPSRRSRVTAVSDFYVNLAGVSGTLLGTFVIAAFFYLDSTMHRDAVTGALDERYIRAAIRWVFAAYSLPVFVSLTLASLAPVYGLVVFVALSVLLLLATFATARRMLAVASTGASRTLVLNEWFTTAALPVIVALPWILGGRLVPPPDAYVPSLLLCVVIAFSSTAAVIMAEFDSKMGEVRATTRRRRPDQATEPDGNPSRGDDTSGSS